MLSVYEYKKLGRDNCWYCGEFIPVGSFRRTADHFWPKKLGGRLRVVCCSNCNSMKGCLTPIEFINYLNDRYAIHSKASKNNPFLPTITRMITATQTLWDRVKWSIKTV